MKLYVAHQIIGEEFTDVLIWIATSQSERDRLLREHPCAFDEAPQTVKTVEYNAEEDYYEIAIREVREDEDEEVENSIENEIAYVRVEEWESDTH